MKLSVLFSAIFFLYTLFILPSPSLAAVFFDSPPPTGRDYSVVSADFCGAPSECVNSQNPGNCNKPTCPPGGKDWTKYSLTCVEYQPPFAEAIYNSYYQQLVSVYSIGDKCISGGPYLNPGYCNSPWGGPIYKTCCSGTGNELSPFQCVPFDADGAGDPEGRCPAGYTREVFCGQPGQPACGQEACGPVGTPKTCDYNRSYNQCCGNNLSQNVQEYVWSDGTGVCNHVVGACNQTDPACANATPPPTDNQNSSGNPIPTTT